MIPLRTEHWLTFEYRVHGLAIDRILYSCQYLILDPLQQIEDAKLLVRRHVPDNLIDWLALNLRADHINLWIIIDRGRKESADYQTIKCQPR